ncbi:MAG: gfo/Idh/MocA family oxidoreductase [Balneolaceae bacterium]|nr:MAG: gfo/Idh/MocA family oxidoreductase [Balneolaceae bacterium]
MTESAGSPEIIYLGIIGLGHIGKYHIRAVESYPEFRLIAVCDRHREFSSLAPEGVSFYSDYSDLLADPVIQTVIIATPNQTHYRIAMDVLKAGKDLILEKPAAESMGELEKLEQTARQMKRSVYYAFHAATAFDVVWTAAYLSNDEIRSELGPVTGFSCRFYDPYILYGELQSHARGLQNCWLDSGINALSVLHHFIGLDRVHIENVSAAMNRSVTPSFTQCLAELSFAIGSDDRAGFGVIDTNWTTGKNHKSTRLIFGKSGNVIEINHSEQMVKRWFPDGSMELLTDQSGGNERLFNHYIGLFKDYFEIKQSKRESLNMNSELAFHTHDLLFRAHERVNRG